MSKQENKQISLISETKVVPSGVARIMELKETTTHTYGHNAQRQLRFQ